MGQGAGTGPVNAEKDTLPQAVEQGGVGKMAKGLHFAVPRLPCYEL